LECSCFGSACWYDLGSWCATQCDQLVTRLVPHSVTLRLQDMLQVYWAFTKPRRSD
jgi:hypothetical protein